MRAAPVLRAEVRSVTTQPEHTGRQPTAVVAETERTYAEPDIDVSISQRRSVIRAPLANRPFMVFAASQAVSVFSDRLSGLAMLALVAFMSRRHGWSSVLALSSLLIAVTLPTVLVGPVAGALVDRWDRRKVMIVSESARCILFLSLPVVALATTTESTKCLTA